MEPKRLKATLQLAQMRFDSDPSDSNKAILEQALEAYEDSLQKTEVQKNEQVSEETVNPTAPEDTAKPGVMTGAFETVANAATPIAPIAQKPVADPTGENGGTISEPAVSEEKKTEVDDQPVS